MLKKSHRFKSIDIIFALLLFAVFAMTVLMVLLSGARIYKDAVDDMTNRYERRTGIAYITTKLRRYGAAGGVRVGTFGGGDALFLSETAENGKEYETVIYMFDGEVREQFAEKGSSFPEQSGLTILPAKSIRFSGGDGGVIFIEYETDEGTFDAVVYLRAKEAAVS